MEVTPWLSCVCQSCWKISRLFVFVLWFCAYTGNALVTPNTLKFLTHAQ